MNKALRVWFIFLLSGFLGGCAIGFDHTLFVTKSNVGIDIDTKPPTAEISIARREIVIAPTFEGGQTPPVLAGFSTADRRLFGFDVSSVFAGGDAAYVLSQTKNTATNSKLCLNEEPMGKPRLGPIPLGTYPLSKPGEIRPFVFGTDTTFGVKVAWSGMTAQFPDARKIGFNRKELALAPVFGKKETDQNCLYSVAMPPFLASIQVNSDFLAPQSSNLTYRQSFSTGSAATELAKDPYVKQLLLSRLDRAPEKGTYGFDDTSECIRKWVESDAAQETAKTKEINDWLKEKGYTYTSTLLINTKEYAKERVQFIEAKKLNCKGDQ